MNLAKCFASGQTQTQSRRTLSYNSIMIIIPRLIPIKRERERGKREKRERESPTAKNPNMFLNE